MIVTAIEHTSVAPVQRLEERGNTQRLKELICMNSNYKLHLYLLTNITMFVR